MKFHSVPNHSSLILQFLLQLSDLALEATHTPVVLSPRSFRRDETGSHPRKLALKISKLPNDTELAVNCFADRMFQQRKHRHISLHTLLDDGLAISEVFEQALISTLEIQEIALVLINFGLFPRQGCLQSFALGLQIGILLSPLIDLLVFLSRFRYLTLLFSCLLATQPLAAATSSPAVYKRTVQRRPTYSSFPFHQHRLGPSTRIHPSACSLTAACAVSCVSQTTSRLLPPFDEPYGDLGQSGSLGAGDGASSNQTPDILSI